MTDLPSPSHPIPELSKAAHQLYNRLVKRIGANFEKVNSLLYQISADLKEIVDKRLYYCGGYYTFADFCQKEFGKTRQAIYQIIQSHDVLTNLLEAGIPEDELPPKERLCRAIRKATLDEAAQARIWRTVLNVTKKTGREPQVVDVETAATEVLEGDAGAEAREHQQEEIIKKYKGVGRSLKGISLSFDVLSPKYRRQLLVVIVEMIEDLTILAKGLKSSAVTERAPKED